ncbi:biotin-dependent carboxyltransferase family protein [Variovorax paradoxus]|uniref:5-oxoprolinase subunit C family protein n=1 Tax=Variovorax paradoxus TaxID=34073 RepID=UPI0021AC6927|nr:biotin-dependent carboxyltransferase family protein [Variovorax paradoxus]UVH59807.1 biotin-dependent carboxyltransferase family protein [Variovorax paradoxus]
MAEARLLVRACGPLVSYQDGGRPGMLRFGVPASGPMDRLAHAAANVALGCPAESTTIEISMGGLEVVCESGEVTCCVSGGDFQVCHSGSSSKSWCVRTIRSGDVLSVRPGSWGSWAYLAFCGELVCDQWAGHTATHSTSGLGGGSLGPGAAILLRNACVAEEREGDLPVPAFAYSRKPVRVVLGPQTGRFEPEAMTALLNESFSVTSAYDRMGMRLSGPKLALKDALSIPSEPIVRGSIQVGGDGVASILLADHQTTGGYPKIATVLSSDLDGLSQLRPRDSLSFQAVDALEAIRLVRSEAPLRSRFLKEIARPLGSLQSRLMRANLISGFVRA